MKQLEWVRLALFLGLIIGFEGCHTTKVLVNSTPPGAEVHWDYEPKGTTPVEFPVEWLGKHRLTLDHPDHEQYVETVDLESPLYLRFPMDLITQIKPYPTSNRYEFNIDLSQQGELGREAISHESESQAKP